VTVFQDLAVKEVYIKAFKAFLWMLCALSYSQGYCKFFIGETIDLIKVDVFELMLEKKYVCGYLAELCT
jgi:membrane protein CcdC involved in cytochrome C biogenesis